MTLYTKIKLQLYIIMLEYMEVVFTFIFRDKVNLYFTLSYWYLFIIITWRISLTVAVWSPVISVKLTDSSRWQKRHKTIIFIVGIDKFKFLKLTLHKIGFY